jgi:tripartite-type tricarboxylate transporter receptor subunit TctC
VRAGTPADVIAKVKQLTTAFITREETKAYLETVGAKPFLATPEELGAFQEADTKRWAEIVAIAKIEKK